MNILGVITEEDLALLNEVFDKEIKHCKSIGNRPTQGYGRATEQLKKEAWLDRANRLAAIQEAICNTAI